jgi:hypothetical protein
LRIRHVAANEVNAWRKSTDSLCDRSLKAWEAIMSSPIHLDEDIDAALIYAPPWTRDRIPSIAESSLQSQGASAATTKMSPKKLKPQFSGDRAMLVLQRQLAIDPDLIPEPSPQGAAVIRPLLARLCGVGTLAALVAWSLMSYSSVNKSVEEVSEATATSTIAGDADNVMDVQSLRSQPTMSWTTQTLAPAGEPQPVGVATAATEPAGAPTVSVTTAAPADAAVTPPTAPQNPVNRRQLRLDSEEIDVLIKRGKDLLGDGDVAAARLLLRRAAEAGSAEGAFTLGTTFDPVSLARLGAIGAAADLAKARQWYRRAAELGSSAASQQLAGLGDAR